MKITIQHLASRAKKPLICFSVCASLLLGISTAALAEECPYAFKLSGSQVDKPWSQVTNNAWNKMLPEKWIDKGFHFYSQVRDRGPENGINTPSDLESEIMKKVTDEPEGHPNRRQILLPILNSKGQNLRVIYDYDGKSTSKCELVTFSF